MGKKILEAFKKIESTDGLNEMIPELTRKSAILIPIICPQEDWNNNILNIKAWKVIFTIRASHLKEHAGEVSFPGGRIDHNETPLQTAFREAQEEISLDPAQVLETISLNNSFARSGYHITPFCSLILNENHLERYENEVSDIISLTIEQLINLKCWSEERSIMQFKRRVWHFPVKIEGIGEIDIWGATGNILKDLLMRFEYLLDK
ncbi:NUDIX hydrolase [Silvanigrella aquatica]|uniref:Nudix hydrolase domain-containing protein n=1 Tax=Silvanigrella aquatica TaxID=1915309 RepID=A0A1L4D3P6_9BACT|nr:CoA pyrophosphatase [Silvanigrella aquatica]APJ04836.1 hypothetical protein AXG55_13385 [Silvanigrella aquatica]